MFDCVVVTASIAVLGVQVQGMRLGESGKTQSGLGAECRGRLRARR
jgi:hypothetical protein